MKTFLASLLAESQDQDPLLVLGHLIIVLAGSDPVTPEELLLIHRILRLFL